MPLLIGQCHVPTSVPVSVGVWQGCTATIIPYTSFLSSLPLFPPSLSFSLSHPFAQFEATGRKLVTTQCGHIFCNVCIRNSISTLHRCPTCRKKLTLKQYHHLYLWRFQSLAPGLRASFLVTTVLFTVLSFLLLSTTSSDKFFLYLLSRLHFLLSHGQYIILLSLEHVLLLLLYKVIVKLFWSIYKGLLLPWILQPARISEPRMLQTCT